MRFENFDAICRTLKLAFDLKDNFNFCKEVREVIIILFFYFNTLNRNMIL